MSSERGIPVKREPIRMSEIEVEPPGEGETEPTIYEPVKCGRCGHPLGKRAQGYKRVFRIVCRHCHYRNTF